MASLPPRRQEKDDRPAFVSTASAKWESHSLVDERSPTSHLVQALSACSREWPRHRVSQRAETAPRHAARTLEKLVPTIVNTESSRLSTSPKDRVRPWVVSRSDANAREASSRWPDGRSVAPTTQSSLAFVAGTPTDDEPAPWAVKGWALSGQLLLRGTTNAASAALFLTTTTDAMTPPFATATVGELCGLPDPSAHFPEETDTAWISPSILPSRRRMTLSPRTRW